MTLIYVIEDEPIMADCIATAITGIAQDPVEISVFNDGVSAMEAVGERLPDVILLDVMLTGPDGFAFLNEIISYPDTAKIPVIVISSLDLSGRNLEHYGVKQVLDKTKMTPEDIYAAIQTALTSTAEVALTSAIAYAEVPLDGQPTTSSASTSPKDPSEIAPTGSTSAQNISPGLDDFKARLAAQDSSDSHA